MFYLLNILWWIGLETAGASKKYYGGKSAEINRIQSQTYVKGSFGQSEPAEQICVNGR